MSYVGHFSNLTIEQAIRKMYEQVYVLTDLQEKLNRSALSETDIDSLLDSLDCAVELARDVVKMLCDTEGNNLLYSALADEPAKHLEEATRKHYEEVLHECIKIYPNRKTALENFVQTFADKPYDIAIIQRMIAECEQHQEKTTQSQKDIKRQKRVH